MIPSRRCPPALSLGVPGLLNGHADKLLALLAVQLIGNPESDPAVALLLVDLIIATGTHFMVDAPLSVPYRAFRQYRHNPPCPNKYILDRIYSF
jgi:hypothetical protein